MFKNQYLFLLYNWFTKHPLEAKNKCKSNLPKYTKVLIETEKFHLISLGQKSIYT